MPIDSKWSENWGSRVDSPLDSVVQCCGAAAAAAADIGGGGRCEQPMVVGDFGPVAALRED